MKKLSFLWSALIAITCSTLIFISCSKSGDRAPSTGGGGSTSQDSVLVKLGTNVILPAYQQLAASTAASDAAVNAFAAAPSLTTLTPLQTAFKSAYNAWEACSEFDFGPAEDASLNTHFSNSFPADTTIIQNNIKGAVYAIDGIANFAAQGFPAIDYLLFSRGNANTLARFTTDTHAAGALDYLVAISGSLKTKTATVAKAWSSTGGNYLATFIKATGVDAGSALSLLVNAYVQDFDVTLQNYKIGIPIGKYGPSVLPIAPEKVEGYYGGLSVRLLTAQVKAIQAIYLGGIDNKVAATAATNGGLPLNDAIKNELTALLAKVEALPDPLPAGITDADPAVTAAYTEIRKTTVLLKADMSSALGIKISFQDDDGD
jgi:uncharacterized protein